MGYNDLINEPILHDGQIVKTVIEVDESAVMD